MDPREFFRVLPYVLAISSVKRIWTTFHSKVRYVDAFNLSEVPTFVPLSRNLIMYMVPAVQFTLVCVTHASAGVLT